VRFKDFSVEIFVDAMKEIVEPFEDVKFASASLPFLDGIAQLVLLYDATVLGDANEDDAVQQSLDDLVQLPGG
jgi:hypothetical protein